MPPCAGPWFTPGVLQIAVLSTALSRREHYVFQSVVIRTFSQYNGAYSTGGLSENHPIPLPSLHARSLLFQVLSHLMTHNSKSVVDIKAGDSGVVLGYQVDEFACNWLAEHFVVESHIHPKLTGKVSKLAHLLEPQCGNYSFWDKVVAYFEHGLDLIFTDSFETLVGLHIFFDEPGAITFHSLQCFYSWLV